MDSLGCHRILLQLERAEPPDGGHHFTHQRLGCRGTRRGNRAAVPGLAPHEVAETLQALPLTGVELTTKSLPLGPLSLTVSIVRLTSSFAAPEKYSVCPSWAKELVNGATPLSRGFEKVGAVSVASGTVARTLTSSSLNVVGKLESDVARNCRINLERIYQI